MEKVKLRKWRFTSFPNTPDTDLFFFLHSQDTSLSDVTKCQMKSLEVLGKTFQLY